MMQKLFTAAILALAVAGALSANPSGTGPASTQPGSAAAASTKSEAPAAGAVSVVPDRFLRGYDPVTVFYPEAVGPSASPSSQVVLPGPSDFLKIEPAVDGEYRWIDSRTIRFLPSIPWPALKTFRIVTKKGSFSLSTMIANPESVAPSSGSVGLEPFSSVVLTFASPIGAGELKRMTTLELRDLPGVSADTAQWLSPSAFQITELETGKTPTRVAYRISLASPVPYGKKLLLHLKISPDPAIPDAAAVYSWDTKSPFRLVAFGSGSTRLPVSATGAAYGESESINCGSGSQALYIEFSDRLCPLGLEEVKRLASFTPSVRNLSFETSDRRVLLRFDADRDRVYRLSVDPSLVVSETGRPVQSRAGASFYFYYRQAEAYLNWKASDMVLERYGPRQLPMESRGIGRLDLRINRIDGESWDYQPFPKSPVAIDENKRPPMSGEEPKPGTDLSSQIRLLPSPTVSTVIDLPVTASTPRSRWGLDIGTYLDTAFGKSASGTYLVGYRTLDRSTTRYWVRVTVTDLSLTAVEEEHSILFDVTSLQTGLPIAGAEVRVEGLKDGKSVVLISGRSDGNGFFRYEHRKGLDLRPVRVIVKKGDDSFVVRCDDPPPSFFANHWSSSGSWLSWLASNPQLEREEARHKGWLTTERPVYRPDETVYILGWVRDWKLGEIRKYTGKPVLATVTGPDDRVWNYPLSPDEAGEVSLEFREKDIPTGDYVASLVNKDGDVLSSASFQILSYRIPLFELNLSGSEKVSLDRPFEVLLTATYYSGGRVTGEDVEWQIEQYPWSVRAPSFPGFVFSTDERFSSPLRSEQSEAGTQTGILDGDGSARLSIDPRAERDGKARRYLITATVRGADRQAVIATRSVYALPPFSVGLKAPALIREGLEIPVEFLALDHNEKPLSGQNLTVRLIHREWHSTVAETDFSTGEAKYSSEAVDIPVSEFSLVSAPDPLAKAFTVKEAGVYIIEVSSRDYLGRRILASQDVFVSGKDQVSWDRKSDALFEMSADRKDYEPGETAQILLKSPYSEGFALVVTEVPVLSRYEIVPIHGGKGILSVPIDASMAPEIPVDALLYRGRAGKMPEPGKDKLDLGRPASVGASLTLAVRPVANQVQVTLDHPEKASPGATVTFTINAADNKGKPLDGMATLWLVDRAVLSLGTEKKLDPLSAFLDTLPSGLRISDTRNRALGFLPIEEVPGGDGTSEALMAELMNRSTVRKNFKTVPFFKTGIPVRGGKAEVEVALPDNLTDFAVRAVVTSGQDRFGTARSVLPVRLSVTLQQVLPRFVRPGDSFLAGATVRITEGKGGSADWAWKVQGLTLTDPARASSTAQRIEIPDRDTLPLRLPLAAPADLLSRGESALVTFAVERKADKDRDAFEIELPVRADAEVRREGELLTLSKKEEKALPLVSSGSRPGTVDRTLLVTTDSRLLAIARGFEYLKNYPHGCLEQRTSQLWPSVAMKEFVAAAGLSGPTGLLERSFADYQRYLVSCQDENSGLLGYWPASTPSVSLTSYVVEFLTAATKASLPVDQKALDRARDGLSRALRSDSYLWDVSWADLERVAAFSALEVSGTFEASYQGQFLSRSDRMDLYTRARLYLALKRRDAIKGDKAKALEKGLFESLVVKKERGVDVLAGVKDFSGSTRVLLTETRTIAAVLEALVASDRKDPRTALLASWLLERAGASGWGSTVDTVAASRALVAWMDAGSSDDIVLEASSGGKKETLSTKGARIASFTLRDWETGTVSLKKGGEKSPVQVFVMTSSLPARLGRELGAENQGFLLERESLPVLADGSLGEARRAPSPIDFTVDQVVEEHLSVVNFQDRDFVAIEMPLAAGLELLDPRLAGAPREATASLPLTLEPSYSLYLDDRVVFYYNQLPKGTYHFAFRARASFEGNYTSPQARAELMYQQTVFGLSAGSLVRIGPEAQK